MNLDALAFACQTYSWEMSLERYRGRVQHMVATAAAAGFAGFEPETVMLGDGWTADGLDRVLDENGIGLAALVLVRAWRAPSETDAERAEADAVIDAVARHPEARIVFVNEPGADRAQLRERQRNAVACMTAVSRRAAGRGVRCTVHPNSPAGSVFRTAEDYDVLEELLRDTEIGFTPDLGHIAAGGMDPLTVVRHWRERVDHVHVKDVAPDGTWAETGEGTIDIPAVLGYLAETGFDGWVTFEDESPAAERDPDAATAKNGDYVRRLLTSEVEGGAR
jgi:inosose dehydratase